MRNELLRGEKLAKTAVNQILAIPDTWDQTSWHAGECKNGCHTVHCIGGWIQVLGGRQESGRNVITDVSELLGISFGDAHWLCAGDRSLSDIYFFIKNLSAAGFDRAGFDRAGFNRAGFDRAGFNRDGFNRAGFNRDGFNRAGFDRAGFNRAGFDRAGFDRAGFDRAGFNRDGKNLKPFEI